MYESIAASVLQRSTIGNILRLDTLNRMADDIWDEWEKTDGEQFNDCAYHFIEFEAQAIFKILNTQ